MFEKEREKRVCRSRTRAIDMFQNALAEPSAMLESPEIAIETYLFSLKM